MLRSHLLRKSGGESGLQYIGYEETTTNGTTLEFTNVPLGPASSNRKTVLAIVWRTNNSASGTISVTVGGVAGTQVVSRTSGFGFPVNTSWTTAIFLVPAVGATGTISVTNDSRTMQWLGVGVYAAYTITTVVDTADAFASPLFLNSVDDEAGIVAVAVGDTPAALNLSGTVSSDLDRNVDPTGDDNQYAFGSATQLSAGNYTVTWAADSQTFTNASAAVFNIPPSIFVYDQLIAEFASASSIALPSGIAEGDVLVLAGGHGGTGTSAFGTALASGWTEITRGPSAVMSYCLAYKVMGSTPDTTLDLAGFSTSGTTNGQVIVAVVRGADTTTPLDVTPVTSLADTSVVNPPSITAVTSKCLFLCGGIVDVRQVTFTAPTNFTLVGNAINTTATSSTTTMAQLRTASTTVDPGAFGGDTDENEVLAYTIAIRPAS